MTVERILNRTAGPASEPVTTAEVKKHLEILATDSTHDTALDELVKAAREQFEHDTGYALLTQTHTLSMSRFPTNGDWNDRDVIPLEIRPVSAITSITYYDTDNAQQTLATTVYGLDAAARLIYLKYNQEWPSITPQYLGIQITMTTGYGSAAAVPNFAKQAILLQVGEWFDPNMRRGGVDAYERLQRRIATPSYIDYV